MSSIGATDLPARATFKGDTPEISEMAVSPQIQDLISKASVEAPCIDAPFEILCFDDLLNRPAKEFLVEGLVGKGDTVMIYGPPKSKKSLVVLDLCAAIATGKPFADWFNVSEPANVLYCYGEGHGGQPNRLKALDHKWKFTEEEKSRLRFVPQAPGLFDPKNSRHIEHFTAQLKSLGEYEDWLRGGFLVIDTFARATQGGNENDTGEMSQMVDSFDQAKKLLECTGMMVHHENRAGGMRGNTALPGALDAFFRSVPTGDSKREGYLAFDEAKDQSEFPNLGWKLHVHSWIETDGRDCDGPYLEWTGQAEGNTKTKGGNWREDTTQAVRLHCRGESDAKTLPQIKLLLSSGVSEKTFGPHLRDLALDPGSFIQSIVKNSRKEDGSAGKSALHYYWDYKQEAQS